MLRRLAPLAGLAAFLIAIGYAMQGVLNLFHTGLNITSGKGPGQVVFYLLMLGGLWTFVRYIWRPARIKETWQAYTNPANQARFWNGFGIGLGVALLVVSLGFSLLLFVGGATSDPSALGRMSGNDIINTLVAMLVVPILVTTEELIFRAIIYNYLRGGGKPSAATLWAANLLSAFLFAYAHGAQWGFHWMEPGHPALFMGLFFFGILIALVYEVSGSLLVGVHTALIFAKIIPDRTKIITLDQTHYWYTGVSNDPRTGPYIWLLFVVLIGLAWIGRRKLHAIAALEPDKIYERRFVVPVAVEEPGSVG
jgi:membrane protease YdiL (CAAX protease family)